MTRVWLARGKVGAWCRETVQRCKAAYGLWKGGKVNTKIGRGVASPRPPMVEVKAKPCPYPRAELARGN